MQKQISLGLGTEYRYFLHALYSFCKEDSESTFQSIYFYNSFSSTTDLEDFLELRVWDLLTVVLGLSDNKNKTESLIDAILTNNDSGHRQMKNM